MRQVILYGLTGADKQYKAVRYYVISEEFITVCNILHCAFTMMDKYPTVKSVYAIDNRCGLRKDYIESITKDTVESCAEFKDILEREGIQVR